MGLAHAWVAARKGKRVVVFERSPLACGASVRNFGMVWPIGQPYGEMREIALRSSALWRQVLDAAKLPYEPIGSLHIAYREDEAEVLREFAALGPERGYDVTLLTSEQALAASPALLPQGLHCALWSPTELIVDPRHILRTLPAYLAELGVEFRFSSVVRRVELPVVETASEAWEVDYAIVCGGDDFETLYAAHFADADLTRCKLQMLRTVAQPGGWKMGPSLASGLSQRHYKNFKICPSLKALEARVAAESPEFDDWGVHGLVSQTLAGELTLGDSHEYGRAVDIFNKVYVDELILRCIGGFLRAPSLQIAERWHGVYAKHKSKDYLRLTPAENVQIVTAPGGAGMTLAFGLAEQTLAAIGLE